jgi:hypothetical protein
MTFDAHYTFSMHLLTVFGVRDYVNEQNPAPFFGSIALAREGNVRLVARFNTSNLMEFTVCYRGTVLASFGLDDIETAADAIEGAYADNDGAALYGEACCIVHRMAQEAFRVACEQSSLAA